MTNNGRVVLVTGAGSGIGKAAAFAFAKAGYAVCALGRTAQDVEQVASELDGIGHSAIALTADVSVESDMRGAVKQVISRFGRLDIVVANAGINGVWAPIDDLRPEEWDDTIATNLRGTYLTIHTTVPHLKAASGGSIVVVSSINDKIDPDSLSH